MPSTDERLVRTRCPGLLCIGDAAHAAQGRHGADLAAVQKRRELPTRLTQRAQVFLQERVVSRVLARKDGELRLPLPLELVRSFPVLARLPARMIGLGVRPEHIEIDAAPAASGGGP